MHFLFVFACLIVSSYAYPCEQCECRNGLLSCTGENVTELPRLNNSEWLQVVHIYNTSIINLENLFSWVSILSVDVRNNQRLPCQALWNFQKYKKHVDIQSDCIRPMLSIFQPDKPSFDWMNILSICPMIFICILLAYVKKKFNIQQGIITPLLTQQQ